MSPNALSLSAESVRLSSAPLLLATSTLYLKVTQAWRLATVPFVTVATLGDSSDVTVTLLDSVGPKVFVVRRSEWPDTFNWFVTVKVAAASDGPAWFAVKSHVPVAPFAISSAPQVVPVLLPTLPAGQEAPVNVLAVKILPYALSQIWS